MSHAKSLIYFGSPGFSADVLKSIYESREMLSLDIVLVVTQPDRPAGRGLALQQTAVKKMAIECGIPVFEYTKDTKSVLLLKIKEINPDYGILYAFNEIITEDIMSLFPQGIWNIHPSLLPSFRGPSPIVYQVILGCKEIGVTIIKIANALDAGDILASSKYEIEHGDTSHKILEKLSSKGFELLSGLLKQNKVTASPQDNALATYTMKLTKEDGYISLAALDTWQSGGKVKIGEISLIKDYLSKYATDTPMEYLEPKYLYYLWRGLHPWPGIWTKVMINGKEMRLKILDVGFDEITQKPILKLVQLEGKKPVPFKQFNAAYTVFGVV